MSCCVTSDPSKPRAATPTLHLFAVPGQIREWTRHVSVSRSCVFPQLPQRGCLPFQQNTALRQPPGQVAFPEWLSLTQRVSGPTPCPCILSSNMQSLSVWHEPGTMLLQGTQLGPRQTSFVPSVGSTGSLLLNMPRVLCTRVSAQVPFLQAS